MLDIAESVGQRNEIRARGPLSQLRPAEEAMIQIDEEKAISHLYNFVDITQNDCEASCPDEQGTYIDQQLYAQMMGWA